MIRLGVNLDHVATIRQARRAPEPDPVHAATLAILGGADGITIHLREDRRHIQDRDLRLLRETVCHQRLNLELAAVDAVVDLACAVQPDEATLVPEKREELTTEGGLDVVTHREACRTGHPEASSRAHSCFPVHRSRPATNRSCQASGSPGRRAANRHLFRGAWRHAPLPPHGRPWKMRRNSQWPRACTSTWGMASTTSTYGPCAAFPAWKNSTSGIASWLAPC